MTDLKPHHLTGHIHHVGQRVYFAYSTAEYTDGVVVKLVTDATDPEYLAAAVKNTEKFCWDFEKPARHEGQGANTLETGPVYLVRDKDGDVTPAYQYELGVMI
jgi:hypothetical protein